MKNNFDFCVLGIGLVVIGIVVMMLAYVNNSMASEIEVLKITVEAHEEQLERIVIILERLVGGMQ